MKPTYEELLAALKRVVLEIDDYNAWQNALGVISRADAKVPYPEHCTRPEQCAGARDCTRTPTCID